MTATRKEYRQLTEDEIALIAKIKDQGEEFIALFAGLPKSREYSLAITKLEEAVMWGVKGASA